jgi:hypothetical protein
MINEIKEWRNLQRQTEKIAEYIARRIAALEARERRPQPGNDRPRRETT